MEQGGPHWGPQAEQSTKAAEGAHQQPCATVLPKECKDFWEHRHTAEKNLKGMILVYFYFIKYTEQQEVHEEADAWKKQVSNADAIFASPLPAFTSAHWVAVRKTWFLRYSYKFYLHGRKICSQRLKDQSTDAQKIPTLPLKTLMAQNN